MTTITRDQAICAFYYEEYNDKNVAKYSKLIDNVEDIEICYKTDPTKPILLCTHAINSDPFHILKYPKKSDVVGSTPKQGNTKKDAHLKRCIFFTTLGQVIAFLDAIYLPENSNNTEVYEKKGISMNDVLSLLWQHTKLMSESTVIGFSRWYSTSKIDFMDIPAKRKPVATGQKVSIRQVYSLKQEYIGTVYQFFNYVFDCFIS
ncbi:hypothetical protein BDA99DRAFT_444018 [Phascolomyces articulosus]|uniref:Uncharacterized protein n=1 Tax=Phascolomyces articulosus TaxID=60185 RepID=A0AAD5K5Z1_9FUNG|nr:hypothetical protein BDA99DRAFT_444018 [Phascolomyces articulosus]